MKYTVSIKNNHEFRRLYSKGKSAASSCLVVYFRRTGRDANRIGITVSTKVGKAVVRNKVRRRLREIYRLNEEKLRRGLDIIIVARVKSAHVSYAQLEREYLKLCATLKLLAERRPET
ncbi:MAG: ribonuclease P protein component [Oscillospiraceae bacterium]|nr:ribonuclease P protein component [Oscillospiraceae bacterium]